MAKSGGKHIQIDEKEVFSVKETEYGSEYKEHLLKQYILFAELSDKLSHRRTLANTFFLSINAVFVTLLGLIIEPGFIIDILNVCWMLLAMVVGVSICYIWRTTLQTYRALNAAKFQIINTIELKLPAAGFLAEWWFFKDTKKNEKHKDLTEAENFIPIVFAFLYLFLFFVVLGLFLIPIVALILNGL